MLLTEIEGKSILAGAGLRIPDGRMIRTVADLECVRRYPVAVKAQVASGGRGLAGGVRRANSPAEVEIALREMMATEFDGHLPESVLVEDWLPIEREVYLSVMVDGGAGGYMVLYSAQGGVAVERGAPPVRYEIGAPHDFRAHALRAVLMPVEADASLRERIISLARRLLHIAWTQDCLTVEINPLAKLADGTLVAADAKVVLDESAAYRSSGIARAIERGRALESAGVARALAAKLMLVWLDGDVGLISGGAGMTMAAMDMVQHAGARPACFLDCSNNPTPDGYRVAFDLLDEHPSVKVILVTIFGGLTRMDGVARVMRDIMRTRLSDKPVVFRLNGTNAGQIGDIFGAAGLENFSSLEEAVGAAVRIAASPGGNA